MKNDGTIIMYFLRCRRNEKNNDVFIREKKIELVLLTFCTPLCTQFVTMVRATCVCASQTNCFGKLTDFHFYVE